MWLEKTTGKTTPAQLALYGRQKNLPTITGKQKKQATPLEPKKRTQWEMREQKKAVAWFHWQYKANEDLVKQFYHVANEGKREWWQGNSLKAMGMKKGMLDIHLDVPGKAKNGTFYCGLRIEVKPRKQDSPSTVSDEQQETIKRMNKFGYFACVCYGFEEIQETIQWYLAR